MNKGDSFLKRVFTFRTVNILLYILLVIIVILLFIFLK